MASKPVGHWQRYPRGMAKPDVVVGAEESTGPLRPNKEEECTGDDGGRCNDDPTYTHGDIMDTKNEDVFRIISLNIKFSGVILA